MIEMRKNFVLRTLGWFVGETSLYAGGCSKHSVASIAVGLGFLELIAWLKSEDKGKRFAFPQALCFPHFGDEKASRAPQHAQCSPLSQGWNFFVCRCSKHSVASIAVGLGFRELIAWLKSEDKGKRFAFPQALCFPHFGEEKASQEPQYAQCSPLSQGWNFFACRCSKHCVASIAVGLGFLETPFLLTN